MKICGFTIIKNAIKFDYPVVEAVNSILPICDKFVVSVGKSDDDTLNLIKNINSPKIKIIETVWDDSLRVGGKVLADETNKSFDAIDDDIDWCFYIQSDEIVHEKYLPIIKENLLKFINQKSVEGLLFNYTHFYGSYDYIGITRNWYKKEIRIIRNDKTIRSYKDAQGFRKDERKLNVKLINASIFHYGWVKHPKEQQAKQQSFNKMWHNDNWMEQNIKKVDEFDYSNIDLLEKFNSTHPKVMQNRIKNMNWKFSFDPTKNKMSLKSKILHFIEKTLNHRFGEYKNYKIIK
jgi:ribosomal protein S18